MNSKPNTRLAWADIKDGFFRYNLWSALAWEDVRRRYRRSTLGPIWLTISTGLFILGLGPLYGKLFNQSFSEYLPYIAISYVSWSLISGVISDACTVFVTEESLFKQIKLPYSLFCYSLVTRNFIFYFHNLLIVVIVFLIYPTVINTYSLLLLLGLLSIAINALWVSLLLGLACTRYRDIAQIVNSIMQLMLFLTPVMWKIDMLGNLRWVALINPFYHFLEIIRAPLFGMPPTKLNFAVVLAFTILGWIGTLFVFARYRSRIPFWV